MHFIRGLKASGKECGQALVMFALSIPLMLLFVGFAIDFGLGFLAKIELAKACDAAPLAIMLNYGKGQTTATAIGQSIFTLNYDASPVYNLTVSTPIYITPTYGFDSNNQPTVNVTATATIRTFFIRLAGIPTLSATDYSQATRPPVILSLVLDKSGSMNDNGGAGALPPAVNDFLPYFIQGTDQLGEVSFSTLATPDVAMTKNFLTSPTSISSFVSGMAFGGATYAQAGLQDAENQITGVSSPPPNAQLVVVFFTDGWANTNSDNLPASGGKVNYGGCAPAELAIGWCSDLFFMNPTTGATNSYTAISSATQQVTYNGTNTFPATDTGPPDSLPAQAPLTSFNICTEADYRTVQLANSMRAQGITVYSIGLGDKINTTYLQEVANDPASPTYNSNEPVGMYVWAQTGNDLDAAFQQIAGRIILRLTQ